MFSRQYQFIQLVGTFLFLLLTALAIFTINTSLVGVGWRNESRMEFLLRRLLSYQKQVVQRTVKFVTNSQSGELRWRIFFEKNESKINLLSMQAFYRVSSPLGCANRQRFISVYSKDSLLWLYPWSVIIETSISCTPRHRPFSYFSLPSSKYFPLTGLWNEEKRFQDINFLNRFSPE